jgi:predicted RecB family nuclease
MYFATDIANFLACRHISTLNRLEAEEKIKKQIYADPGAELLRTLGLQHEKKYLEEVRARGLGVREIRDPKDVGWVEAAGLTRKAMVEGMEVIYQATLLSEQEGKREKAEKVQWAGRADFLVRVDKPSQLGDWSYEVVEAKLARSTKARAIIQLCFYSDLLSAIQGVLPDYMHVVLGGGKEPEKFFVQRYLAFFRKIKHDFVEAQEAQSGTYPEPVEHCRICDWSTVCDEQWRKDDHLSLVANITRNQRETLVAHGTDTVLALAQLPVPPEPKIEGIKDQAFANINQQARLQVQGRVERRNVYELLVPPEPEKGLCSLPEPSHGDVFLDFEGDQFAFASGLEYLFGVVTRYTEKEVNGLTYQATWVMNPDEEKSAFEEFIKAMIERHRVYPDMHIYHYGSYEETAIKRMSNQHSICVDEVDELLRGEVLVDMLRAVRQGLRASVESYSIKKLEPFYAYKRDVNLPEANRALAAFQTILAFGPGPENLAELKDLIAGYNRDDCVSAFHLRDWLERLRKDLEKQTGAALPRPAPKETAPSEDLSEYLQRARAVEERLTAALPKEKETWTESQKALALMADLIEWHRREDKSKYWEYYNRCEFSDEEFITDRATMGGMVHLEELGRINRSVLHRYSFPLQDSSIERALALQDPKTKEGTGELHALDWKALTIDLKRGPSLVDAPHPTALVPYDFIQAKAPRESLLQIGNSLAENGIAGDGPCAAAQELLLRHLPRLQNGELADFDHLCSLEAAKRISLLLDRTVLPIQGPPGSGKTFTGAHMILELVKDGKKVGVAAGSHKVISNLLKETCKAAAKHDIGLKIVQRCDGDDGFHHQCVKIAKNNGTVDKAIANNEAQIIAGTVYLWSRPEMAASVDVLFVDEAGQMSLANVLAASSAANSIVLLGDPQQLDQPQRGVHPEGAEASALSHPLNGRETIAPGHGLFLTESWRLHPDICAFTSDVFYEDRLSSRPENSNQRLNVAGSIGGTGLRFVPVEHKGNQSDSPEEVEKVFELMEFLLCDGSTWTDNERNIKKMTVDDILIVAPYNAQVSMLLRRLRKGSRVGTVDKFQGQESPVVIYSMATSTPQDAPRGMEFLYSANRLNVATSRAQCVTVLVASPALFDVQCKTPRQIELANAFCRYLEMAIVA